MSNDTVPDTADGAPLPPQVAVVIPYYQKRPGILGKAVRSALAQQGAGPSVVMVVDDASPVPARAELADLMAQQPGRIVLLEQANGRPATWRARCWRWSRAMTFISPTTTSCTRPSAPSAAPAASTSAAIRRWPARPGCTRIGATCSTRY